MRLSEGRIGRGSWRRLPFRCEEVRWGLARGIASTLSLPRRFFAPSLSAAVLLGSLGLLGAGCRAGEPPPGFLLQAAVETEAYSVGEEPSPGLSFRHRPKLVEMEFLHERRPVVLTTVDGWSWRGKVPVRAWLQVGVQTVPAAWGVIHRLEVMAVLRAGDTREILDLRRAVASEPPGWLDFGVDLSPYAGQEVTLEFTATLTPLPPEHRYTPAVSWGPVSLWTPSRRAPGQRPNVLFILVDTLRFDRLTCYGYGRETSPRIQELLAARGVVVEDAYAQAPWTLPSAVSYMTGRIPGDLLGDNPSTYGIPGGVSSLPEAMAELGYTTGGFLANKLLHPGNGFHRGFATFFTSPSDATMGKPDAAGLNARAIPWLRAHQSRPFFLYVHYIDPHDPYQNPDLVDGRSPFFPDYSGPVAGDWIHGIYNGRIDRELTEEDLAHINALYDSEIRYVDRHIGELLEALAPEVLANTLVVLTSDHGEELYDHGGWKHGQTLYEEQIHVPLIFRWDGRIPAGRRLQGTVRLVDLLPTLMAAAGGSADPEWSGVNLLPALTGQAPLPERPAFAQHLASGPLRAAAIRGRRKLILFNRETPFAPADGHQEHLWRVDLARLERQELYDLRRDPEERRNLASQRPEEVEKLGDIIHRHLGPHLFGLRVVVRNLPEEVRLGGRIVLDRPPQRWSPYFLGPDDRVELRGSRLTFDLRGDHLEKGFIVEGEFAALEEIRGEMNGRPLVPAQILLGPGTSYAGERVAREALKGPAWPPAPGEPVLQLWEPEADQVPRRRGVEDPETRRRLKALGYLQ